MSLLTLRAPESAPLVAPDRVAAVRRSGRNPHRILMIGGGVLRGIGLRSHNLGLPGHVADALASSTGRGVDLDVIVEEDPTAERAREALRGLRLRRYDAIVVFLDSDGVRSLGGTDRCRRQVERLCVTLQDEAAPDAPVVVYDAPADAAGRPGLGSRRSRSTVERLAAEVADVSFAFGLTFATLPPETRPSVGRGVSATSYAVWADAVVGRLLPRLRVLETLCTPDTPRAFRHRPDPERPRMRALTQLRLVANHRDPLLDYIAVQAKVTFRAKAAHLNVIDQGAQWTYASSEPDPGVLERELAFCDHTIRTDGLTLVNDAKKDPRFRENPLTEGADPIRFYAGYPIHTWDGYRLGALCIVGATPRSMLPSELLPLQDFAGRIEQELWAMALRRPHAVSAG